MAAVRQLITLLLICLGILTQPVHADPRNPTLPERPQGNPAERAPESTLPARQPPQPIKQLSPGREHTLPYCLLPGQIFTIALTESDNPFFRLRDGRHHYPLKLVAVQPSQVRLQIPQQLPVVADRLYPLEQAHNPLAAHGRATGISIRICASPQVQPKALLLSYDDQHHTNVLDILQKNNLTVMEDRFLPALALRLVKVSPLSVDQPIHKLRALLPFADIDRNDDLTPAAKARLYHQALLSQKTTATCTKYDTSAAPKIGMIDGQVAQQHNSLRGQLISAQRFVENKTATTQHATQIASILLGNDAMSGFSGLLTGSHLYSADVLALSPSGQAQAETFAVVSALDWLLQQQVRLISVSLVTHSPNRVMHRAFDRASQQGALLFAAVGNDGADAPANYPAAFPEVIAITAVDAAQQLYNQANQNSGTDFAAPGVDIWVADPGSATLNNQGSYATGTSFATPMAMAVAANVVRKHPNIPKSLLLRVLHEASIDLGEPGEDSLYGAGLLQQICLNPKIQDKAIRTQR